MRSILSCLNTLTGKREEVTNLNPLPVTGAGGGGGAVTVADAADVTQGALADAVVAAGAAGSISAKLRRLTTDLDAVKTLLTSTGALKDNGPAWTPVRANKSSADLSTISDLSAAPTSGQKIVIDDLWVSVDTAMRVDVSEETSGTVVWSVYLPANGAVQYTPRDGLKLDTADKKARIQTSVAGNIRVTCLSHSAA